MTWGECRLACLQRMFANEGTAIQEGESSREYLQSMPAAANEGIQILAENGRLLRKRFQVAFSAFAAEGFADGKLTLTISDALYFITLSDYCPDLRTVLPGEVYEFRDGAYGKTDEWAVEGGKILRLNGSAERTLTFWYAAWPVKLTPQTEDGAELGISEDAAVLLPLYMASELYKDDDVGMAVQFRNEFEDGLGKLQAAESAAWETGTVRNTRRWY